MHLLVCHKRKLLTTFTILFTRRKPMMSWIMKLWRQNHPESEWPDLSICQPEDACHVTTTEKHPSKENIEKMCSEDFFVKHHYKYVGTSSTDVRDDEYYASCSSEGSFEVDDSFDSLKRNEAALVPEDYATGSTCPMEKESEEESNWNKSLHKETEQNETPRNEALLPSNDEAAGYSYPDVMQEMYEERPASVIKNQVLSPSTDEPSGHSYPYVLGEDDEDPPADVMRPPVLSGAINNLTSENKPLRAECHSYNENTADILFSTSADISDCMTSYNTKRHPNNEVTTGTPFYMCTDVAGFSRGNTTCHRGSALTASNDKACSYSYPDEKEDEYEDPHEAAYHTSGYLRPVEMECDESNDTKCHPYYISSDPPGVKRSHDTARIFRSQIRTDHLHYSSVDVAGCKKVDHTKYELRYCEIRPEKKLSQGYQTLAFNLDVDDGSLGGDSFHQFSKDNTCLDESQNMAYQQDEDDNSSYDDVIGCLTEYNTHL